MLKLNGMAFFEGRWVGLGFLFLQTLIRSLCFVWHHVGLVSQMSRPINLGEYQFAVSVSILKDNISIVNLIDQIYLIPRAARF